MRDPINGHDHEGDIQPDVAVRDPAERAKAHDLAFEKWLEPR
jgi:hypothetical protein